MSTWAEQLTALRHHWSGAYAITRLAPGVWIAQRRDTRETLRGEGPEELLELIRQDYRAHPVSR